MVYIAEVHAPDLVPPRGLEGHLLLFFGAPPGLLEAVELAVDGEDASTGARTQVNAQLLQRRRDAKLAELGVLLKLPHLVHRPKVHLAHAFAGLVLQAVYAFGDPLLQRSVDGGAAGLQIVWPLLSRGRARSGETSSWPWASFRVPVSPSGRAAFQDEPADLRVQSAAPRGGLLCSQQ